MNKFGSKYWNEFNKKFIQSNWRSRERWGLNFVHNQLDELTYALSKEYLRRHINVNISLDSIWIDGTPQASATKISGGLVQCELGDLLFIFDEYDKSLNNIKKVGLIIQAKISDKYNSITPAGPRTSTFKERDLLEITDRSKPLDLYRDTARKAKIGSYIFGNSSNTTQGLRDISSYMLMPKDLTKWGALFPFLISPFQMGWPRSRSSWYIKKPICINQMLQHMAFGTTWGKPILSTQNCQWSKMVSDLIGNYSNVKMQGYNQQDRITKSKTLATYKTTITGLKLIDENNGGNIPPILNGIEDNNNPPAISIVRIIVQHK